ncbi:MAG: pentapeptide repeat-containing protein [Nitrospirae bacterium]|nr:MAG: pentapeptide repeat-containing protein [Nitrospirota bacterium]
MLTPSKSLVCTILMSNNEPCGREVHSYESKLNDRPVCIMHSSDPEKDFSRFHQEIVEILAGESIHSRRAETFDFSWFVFLDYHFGRMSFERKTIFRSARFLCGAHFSSMWFAHGADFTDTLFENSVDFQTAVFAEDVRFDSAQFSGEANFRQVVCRGEGWWPAVNFKGNASFAQSNFSKEANFSMATFESNVDFSGARFAFCGNFKGATFREGANFASAVFASTGEPAADGANVPHVIADFSGARYEKPSHVSFYQVNRDIQGGLRARFVNCNMEAVRFVDVNWHRWHGRKVLQDELDIVSPLKNEESETEKFFKQAMGKPPTRYELVAVGYRKLVDNFEKVREYDSAEDFSIGVMEMKRLDPAQPIFVRVAVNLYRWASNYGSNYWQALVVLALMVVVFGLLYSLVGLTPRPKQTVLEPIGLVHAVEVATFKGETHAIAGNGVAWFLEILERVLIPAQVALLLLALRRRFRR